MRQILEEASKRKYKFSNIQGIESLSTGPFPTSFRSCTDPFCCLFFLVTLLYFLGVGISAIFLGDVNLIGAPYDPNHRACGVSEGAEDYPYIYFATPINDSSGNYVYRTICLMECPMNIPANVYSMTLKCLINSVVTSCSFKASPESESVLFYNTVPYLGNVCLPQATLYFANVEDYIDAGWVTNVIVDIKHSFFMISAGLVLTCFLGLIFFKCLQCCDKIMIHGLLALYLMILLLFGSGFIYKGFTTTEIDDANLFQNSANLINTASVSTNGLLAYIIGGALLIFLALISSIYLFFHQDYFKILNKIMNSTFELLADNNSLLCFSLCLYVILSCILMGTIALALYIYSIGFVNEDLAFTLYFPFNQFQNSPFFYYNLWGLLFFMAWLSYFILGYYQFVIMGTASHWYFRDLHIDTECQRKGQKRQLDQISYSSRYVIKTYVRLGLTKHFGSLTLGSFMILTFGWLNSILTFTKERLEFSYQRRMSQKSCFNSIYKCFFWFFKKYIRFNTKIAYMMVAYKGNSFISSGRYMSQIIDEYYDIFSEISALTALFAFGLNLVCSFIPSLIFYYVFEYIPWYGLYLSSSLHPAMVIGMLSFINISIFNTMFSNIVDSLLICYFIDKENLSYARKLLHFNKDPDYHQIPKEPSLKNNYFLQTLIEHSNKKHQKNIPPNNENSMNNISDPPSEVQRQSQEDLKKVTHHPNRKFPKTIIMGLETKKESPSQKQILQNRFVEQYSLPKINDIIRGSSSIDNAWITDEKKLPVPSKHRLEQQGSPYKESPFSDVIWNNNENVFNFQREGFKLNINLKMEENL